MRRVATVSRKRRPRKSTDLGVVNSVLILRKTERRLETPAVRFRKSILYSVVGVTVQPPFFSVSPSTARKLDGCQVGREEG